VELRHCEAFANVSDEVRIVPTLNCTCQSQNGRRGFRIPGALVACPSSVAPFLGMTCQNGLGCWTRGTTKVGA
jgi:hypothetical protein